MQWYIYMCVTIAHAVAMTTIITTRWQVRMWSIPVLSGRYAWYPFSHTSWTAWLSAEMATYRRCSKWRSATRLAHSGMCKCVVHHVQEQALLIFFCRWVWLEGGQNGNMEQNLDVGGFGYPVCDLGVVHDLIFVQSNKKNCLLHCSLCMLAVFQSIWKKKKRLY